ncbi:hypothetical protein FOZ62_031443, partial [Perkinsus olseni]
NVYLSRYVTDEKFDEKCEEMLADEEKTFADILAWCGYMESIEDTRPQLYRSTHVSIEDAFDQSIDPAEASGDCEEGAIEVYTARVQVDGVYMLTVIFTMQRDRRDSSVMDPEYDGIVIVMILYLTSGMDLLASACTVRSQK